MQRAQHLTMDYRRSRQPGGNFFFTLVTHQRQKILIQPDNVARINDALKREMAKRPFTIEAFVLLPDHRTPFGNSPRATTITQPVGVPLSDISAQDALGQNTSFRNHVDRKERRPCGNGAFGATPSTMKKIGGGTWITFITTQSNMGTWHRQRIGHTVHFTAACNWVGIRLSGERANPHRLPVPIMNNGLRDRGSFADCWALEKRDPTPTQPLKCNSCYFLGDILFKKIH